MARPKAVDAPTGTQVLDRAVAVLKYIGDVGQRGARANEIGKALGLTTSTAHRVVQGLERHKLIEKEVATKRYRLGLLLFEMGTTAANATAFRKLCHPAMRRIADELGDTVLLLSKSGHHALCVDRQEGNYTVNSLTGRETGGQLPLGVGPGAQLILAMMPVDQAHAIARANSDQYARFNNLTAEEVIARLPVLRRQGYAVERDRYVEGLSAIAMPVRPLSRDLVGCITVNMATHRLTSQRQEKVLRLLRQEIDEIEASVNPLDLA